MGRRMRKSYQQLAGLAEETAVRHDVAAAAQRKTRIKDVANTALAHALTTPGTVPDMGINPVIDDGLPPNAPQNVAITPIIKGLAISWNAPGGAERVKRARVRLTPQAPAGTPEVYETSTTQGYTITGLQGGRQYKVEAMLVDAFGDESGWSAPSYATALVTAAEYINAAEVEIAGKFGWTNLENLTDPDNLGDDVVVGRAIATHTAAMFQLWASTAMIGSAYIDSLVADKIVGGTISTTDIFVASKLDISAGGKLQAGPGTKVDDGGLTINAGSSLNATAFSRDFKVCPPGEWAAQAFYDDSAQNVRGPVLRADGAGTKRGMVAMHAATGSGELPIGVQSAEVSDPDYLPPSTPTGRLEVFSDANGAGYVVVAQDLHVDRAGYAANFILRPSGVSLWGVYRGRLGANVLTRSQMNNSLDNGAVDTPTFRSLDGAARSAQPYCSTPLMHLSQEERLEKLELRRRIAEAPELSKQPSPESFEALASRVELQREGFLMLSSMLMDYAHTSGDEREEAIARGEEWALAYAENVGAGSAAEISKERWKEGQVRALRESREEGRVEA